MDIPKNTQYPFFMKITFFGKLSISFVLFLAAGPALAKSCEVHGSYLVVEEELDAGPGNRILIYKKTSDASCKKLPKKFIYKWDRGEDADNDLFDKIIDDTLIISEGTGGDPNSTLIGVDLKAAKQIFNVPARNFKKEGHLISYGVLDEKIKIRGPAKGCKERIKQAAATALKISVAKLNFQNCDCEKWIDKVEGNPVFLKSLDLKTGKIKDLEAAECGFVQ
ncbi:MAG: hypothetical protein AB7H97_04830 [Pseudobdellovibrionaceae bacterium]